MVIGTRPEFADDTMGECAELGIKHVWMHRGPQPDAAVLFGGLVMAVDAATGGHWLAVGSPSTCSSPSSSTSPDVTGLLLHHGGKDILGKTTRSVLSAEPVAEVMVGSTSTGDERPAGEGPGHSAPYSASIRRTARGSGGIPACSWFTT